MIYKVYTDHYIAAIIQGTFELGQWLIGVPKDRAQNLRIEIISQVEYPFQMLECEFSKKRFFIQVTDDVNGSKKAYTTLGIKVLATYLIEKDFLGDPKNPGEDYMGILPHDHEPEEDDET